MGSLEMWDFRMVYLSILYPYDSSAGEKAWSWSDTDSGCLFFGVDVHKPMDLMWICDGNLAKCGSNPSVSKV